jgi:hypothetical protein
LSEQAVARGFEPDQLTNIAHCLSPKCEPLPVWQLVLGLDKGWEFFVLAVTLIGYNVLRARLTWSVSQMRDEEERSGYTPPWLRGYRPLYWTHQAARVLWLAAVVAFSYNAWYWLSRTVWIPV